MSSYWRGIVGIFSMKWPAARTGILSLLSSGGAWKLEAGWWRTWHWALHLFFLDVSLPEVSILGTGVFCFTQTTTALGEKLCDQSDASVSFCIKIQSRNRNIIISAALFTWCFLSSLPRCISIKLWKARLLVLGRWVKGECPSMSVILKNWWLYYRHRRPKPHISHSCSNSKWRDI